MLVLQKKFTFSTGPKHDAGVKKKRGRQMRPINKIMSTSILKSGCVRSQTQEMFEESGIICPSNNGLDAMMEKVNGTRLLFLLYLVLVFESNLYIIFRCRSICFRGTTRTKLQSPLRGR